jgi:hypothetical protein
MVLSLEQNTFIVMSDVLPKWYPAEWRMEANLIAHIRRIDLWQLEVLKKVKM